jgi:cell division protein FtsB
VAAPRSKRRTKKATARRRSALLRASVVGVAVLVGVLYYRPLANYVETKRTLDERRTEVQQLRDERRRLEERLLRSATTEALSREARRLGLVREGERLFIVKGIPEWRRTIRSRG